MPHFYVRPEDISGSHFSIRGEEVHHIQHVLKKKIGDTINIFDGIHRAYVAQIEHMTSDDISGILVHNITDNVPSSITIHLFQGIPRGQKMDYIVEKCTELGVSSITPVICRRSIKKISPDKNSAKFERWDTLALAASKQSGRLVVPTIHPAVEFAYAIRETTKADIQFLPWEGETNLSLKEALQTWAVPYKQAHKTFSINVWIGPEGGFAAEEITLAQEHSVHPVTLGNSILRTETAGIVTLAIIQYELNLL
ncbi:MAG: 16S rRNA (uracil(1498)-N(3))-methyltransferase [bacterium]